MFVKKQGKKIQNLSTQTVKKQRKSLPNNIAKLSEVRRKIQVIKSKVRQLEVNDGEDRQLFSRLIKVGSNLQFKAQDNIEECEKIIKSPRSIIKSEKNIRLGSPKIQKNHVLKKEKPKQILTTKFIGEIKENRLKKNKNELVKKQIIGLFLGIILIIIIYALM